MSKTMEDMVAAGIGELMARLDDVTMRVKEGAPLIEKILREEKKGPWLAVFKANEELCAAMDVLKNDLSPESGPH